MVYRAKVTLSDKACKAADLFFNKTIKCSNAKTVPQ